MELWYHTVDFLPLLYSGSMKRWLRAHIRDFDVVHIHGLYRFGPSYAARLARRWRVPYLIQPHGALDLYLYERSTRSLLLKRVYERFLDFPNLDGAAGIVSTSVEERRRIGELGFKAPGVIVPNGLDLGEYGDRPERGGFRRKVGIADDVPLVLFLGRLNFKKGLDVLIPAFAKLSQQFPAARLAIVGPDNEGYDDKVEAWCRESGVEEQIIRVDYLELDGVRQAYVDADVFVLSSYTENFGLTVIEAMACECPVVVSDQVNICTEVRDAAAGIVTGLDPAEVAEAMARVLGDASLATEMGRAGRRLVEQRFDWEPLTLQLDEVYLQIQRERGQ